MPATKPYIVLDRSFRFADPDLQAAFVRLLRTSGLPYYADRTKTAFYSSADVLVVENELIQQVRDSALKSWSVLHCPADWVDRYRAYMTKRRIRFYEQVEDGEISFLIPGNYNPHTWAKV